MMNPQRSRRFLTDLVKGSPDAWRDFVQQTLGAVHAAIRQTFAKYGVRVDEADIEDLAASLYSSMIKNDYRVLRRIGPPYDYKSFMVISARRRAIDALRLRKRTPRSLDSLDSFEPSAQSDGGAPAAAPEQLDAALKTLPPRDAMLVRLVYVHNKSYREAASLAGMPLNSVGPTLVRALGKIRKALGPRGKQGKQVQ